MPVKITGWRIAGVLMIGGLVAGGVYMIQSEAARAAVADKVTEFVLDIQASNQAAQEQERDHYERIQTIEADRDAALRAIERERSRVRRGARRDQDTNAQTGTAEGMAGGLPEDAGRGDANDAG